MPWVYTNVLITLNIYFKFYKNIHVWILQKLFNLCPGITQMFWLHWIYISSFIKNIHVWLLQKLFNLCPGITQMFWLHWIYISSFIKNIHVWLLQKLFNLCPGITQMFWLHWIYISSFIKIFMFDYCKNYLTYALGLHKCFDYIEYIFQVL